MRNEEREKSQSPDFGLLTSDFRLLTSQIRLISFYNSII